MSRCFPYRPPYYGQAQIESIKLQKKIESSTKKEEREKSHKKHKREDKQKFISSDTDVRNHKKKTSEEKKRRRGKHEEKNVLVQYKNAQKISNEVTEHLERSGLTEDHELPFSTQYKFDSPESSLDSNKRRKVAPCVSIHKTRGTVLRIKFPSSKQNASEPPLLSSRLVESDLPFPLSRSRKPDSTFLLSGPSKPVLTLPSTRQVKPEQPLPSLGQIKSEQPFPLSRSRKPDSTFLLSGPSKPVLTLPSTRQVKPEQPLPSFRQIKSEQPLPTSRQRKLELPLPTSRQRKLELPLPPSRQVESKLPLPSTRRVKSKLGLPSSTQIKSELSVPSSSQINSDRPSPLSSQVKSELLLRQVNSELPFPSLRQSDSQKLFKQITKPIVKGQSAVDELPCPSGRGAVTTLCPEASVSLHKTSSSKRTRSKDRQNEQFRELTVNWKALALQADSLDIDDQWLMEAPRRDIRHTIECKASTKELACRNYEISAQQPRAYYMQEFDAYQLPYVLPY